MTSSPVIDALRDSLESTTQTAPLLVGFSGGMDSHVLLHALRELCAAPEGRLLRAVHVNHGLHPDADAWQSHCESVCRDLDVPIIVTRVDVPARSAHGPEAAARQCRYRAFADLLDRNEVLCLAHHSDDQAETFLLQLLRGAGPKGLSAMPSRTTFAAGALLRPLLSVSRSALRDYAERGGLPWVEDSANADLRFDRNFLRHEIIPLLRARWPGAVSTIARAAGHQATIARVADAIGVSASLTATADDQILDCATLAMLDADVASLAVRAWLTRSGFAPPSATVLARIFDEVIGAGEDANPLVAWNGVEVRRYRGRLYCMSPLGRADTDTVRSWDIRQPLDFSHGRLEATPVTGQGLDAARLGQASVEVRFRRGGERCRPAGHARSSTLKHWFQQQGIPPWERDRIPLIFVNTELAAVAGAWICAGFESPTGAPGWLLHWQPHPASESRGGV